MFSEQFWNMIGICIIIYATENLILYAIDFVGGIKEIIKNRKAAKGVKTNGTKP
mgnify:FL=1